MAIVFSRPTVATATAAIFQVLKADLVGTVTTSFEMTLNIRRVSIEED